MTSPPISHFVKLGDGGFGLETFIKLSIIDDMSKTGVKW